MDAEKRMMQRRIDNLCEQLEMVKRERDALRYDLQLVAFGLCPVCRYNNNGEMVCSRAMKVGDNCFVWRGLVKENGGIEE